MPQISVQSSLSHSKGDEISKKSSLNKIQPSSQNSISKLSRGGNLEEESMATNRPLLQLSSGNIQSNFNENYKFQTADSQEQLLNTQEPTAQPTNEGRASILRSKSTQKSQGLQNSSPQSPLAKSNNDKLRSKKNQGKFGKQRNFKHKAAELYAMGNSQRDLIQPTYFIVLPDDYAKIIWDTIMLIFIIFTSIMTPYQISFHSDDTNLGMLTYNYIVDGLFCLDIVINFYMAYYDDNHELVIDRKVIASHYLRGWFFYDLASISSLLMLVPGMDSSDWLKFFRIVRVLRIAKLVKDNPTMAKLFQDTLKVSSGVERLFFFLIAVLIFTHFMACLWYFQAEVQGFEYSWVADEGLVQEDKFEIYIASMYFILATLTTVGYGDIAAFNTVERVLCIIIMSFGVFVFSFSIGSLSSVLTSMDNNLAKFKEKQKILKIMKKQHNIPFVLEDKILKALRYDFKKSNQDKSEFLNSLPTNLKTELALVMHQKVIEDIAWLQQKEDQFVSSAAPRFKAIRFNAGDVLFKEGTPNEDIFFIISGKVAFVLPEYNDLVYVTMERGEYVGDIDFAANKDKGIRLFTVKALQRTDAYFLNVADLHQLELYFQDIMLEFFDNAEVRYKQAKRIRQKAEKHIIKQSEAVIQHQVQKAIMRAKQQTTRQSITKMPMIEEEKVVENFQARQGLGGQLAKIRNNHDRDSGTIESADSFRTSSSSDSKSKATSTFKSDSSFVDQSAMSQEDKKASFEGSSDIETDQEEEEDEAEEKKIDPSKMARRGSTQRFSNFGGFGGLKIHDLNESQKIMEEDESNCSDLTSIRKSKKGFGKVSALGKSKTGKTSNSYDDGSPSNGKSPDQIPKIAQILRKEENQMSPTQRNSLTVPLQSRKSIPQEFQEAQSPGLRRQSVNQVRERKSKLGSQMHASHSPVGSSLQSSILETQSPLQQPQPQQNTPAAVPFSIGAVNLPRKRSSDHKSKFFKNKESSSKDESQEEKKTEPKEEKEQTKEEKKEPKQLITPSKEIHQFKIKIHEAESPPEKLDLGKLTENSDNDLNVPHSKTSKHTKRSQGSNGSGKMLKKKKLLSANEKMNSQELEGSSSAQEEHKKSGFLNKKEIQKSSHKRRSSMAASTEVLNGLSALIQQQKQAQEPKMKKVGSIERRNTHNNFTLSSFQALEGAKNSNSRKKKDKDESRSNGFLNSQRSLKVIKTTVGGTAQVSNFGVINSTMEHNPIIETMAKKIEDLKKKARYRNPPSGSDNEKFNSDLKKDIKEMMKQNQQQTEVQNQLNLQILQTLKKLTEQVEMQSESMGTNLVNKSMGSNGEFLVDSDNDKGIKSSYQSTSSKNIKLSSSGRGVKKQQRSNHDQPVITVQEISKSPQHVKQEEGDQSDTRNETGEVKKRLAVSARPENRDQL